MIILENVDARSDGDVLFVPGDRGLRTEGSGEERDHGRCEGEPLLAGAPRERIGGGHVAGARGAKRVLQGEVIARLRAQQAS